MQVVGWDTETGLFGPACMAPPLVVSAIASGSGAKLYHAMDGPAVLWALFEMAQAGEIVICGHNVAYDVGVALAEVDNPDFTRLVFDVYDKGAISDTELRQKLLDIADGCYRGWTNAATGKWIPHGYSLADVAFRHLGKKLEKGADTWRTRYIELIDYPVDQWPQAAVDYAMDDAVATRNVWLAQKALADTNPRVLTDEPRQMRAALALHLTSAWGLRTDREGVELLRKGTEAELARLGPILMAEGLLRKNGSRAVKLARQRMEAVNPEGKRTPKGAYSLDQEACAASGDPVLVAFTGYSQNQNILSNSVRAMEKGIEYPIHTRFDSLMETGRTSSSAPNVQNPRRKPGVRECFIPRPGNLFAACDFDKAELHTLGQVCLKVLGQSRLAERLNQGFDPHLDLGAQIIGIAYDEALEYRKEPEVKEARQQAKPANFGFPGGMGVNGFVAYAQSNYGLTITKDFAKELRDRWLETWPEMQPYFDWVRNLCGEAGVATITHLFSGRIRGHVPYTVACNSFFQGLCADGAKAALYVVAKAQYADPQSPLYGCRTVNFIHDELLVEVPENRAHAAAMELQRLMIEAFNPWVPDVPVKAGVSLMRRWSKNAEPAYNGAGELIPWEDAA